jgi:hypothetical protein
MNNVTSLTPKSKKSSAQTTTVRSAGFRRRIARQRMAAYGIGSVALVLTGLSLSHLAGGVELVTQSSPANSWAMASGIDLGFIALELGQLSVSNETLRKQVSRFARPAVLGTLITSALMNAYAFAAPALNVPFEVAASLLGVSIPALIYVLTRVSVAMWMDANK